MSAALSCGKVVSDLPGDGRAGGPDAPSPPPANSVRRTRLFPPALNAPVTLKDVVITGHVTFKNNAQLFVQDMGVTGPNTGIRLVCGYPPGCNLTRQDVDQLAIGQVVDVAGRYDIAMPAGIPAEGQVTMTQFTVKPGVTAEPLAMTIDATQVAHTNLTGADLPPLLSTYVKVAGPLKVSNLMPASLMDTCERALDAGISDVRYNGVYAVAADQTTVLAIALAELTNYCLPQCAQTCPTDVKLNDTLQSVTGVLRAIPGTIPELTIRPSRDSDIVR